MEASFSFLPSVSEYNREHHSWMTRGRSHASLKQWETDSTSQDHSPWPRQEGMSDEECFPQQDVLTLSELEGWHPRQRHLSYFPHSLENILFDQKSRDWQVRRTGGLMEEK